jgi:hypothetical protein
VATEGNRRHGCLTIWLLLLVLWNLTLILTYTGCNVVQWFGDVGEPFGWYFPIMIALAVLSIVFVFALFGWKKWGFWGLLGVSAMKVGLEVWAGGRGFGVLAGVIISMLILFGVLNLGRENKGWPQLR